MPLLHHYEFGDSTGIPLVILHGLLGSARNWTSMAKLLSEDYRVFTLDLRNHGQSFHDEAMTFTKMVADLKEWLDFHNIQECHLIGHSLGGKVAMRFGQCYSDRVRSLLILDIAPKKYLPHHQAEFSGMSAIPLEKISSRKEAENILSDYVSDWAMRQFLLTNLDRSSDGFRWKVNLATLSNSANELAENPLQDEVRIKTKTLIVQGGQSSFITSEDIVCFTNYFMDFSMLTFKESGHNPHIDQSAKLLQEIKQFIPPSS